MSLRYNKIKKLKNKPVVKKTRAKKVKKKEVIETPETTTIKE